MGLGSSTLDYLRMLFKEPEYKRAPIVPVVGYTGFTSASPYFNYSMTAASLAGVGDYLRIDSDLVSRYVDMEDMDESPLVASAVDIWTDDSSQEDLQENRSFWVTSDDEFIRNELNDLFNKRLKTEETIWQEIRTLVKYGNSFAEIVAKDKQGVLALNSLPPPTVRRIELPKQIGQAFQFDEKIQDTLGFIYDPRGTFTMSTKAFAEELMYKMTPAERRNDAQRAHDANGATVLESWEVMHMRLLGKNPYTVYGFGIAEPARWIFKRLMMLEDSIILHRLTRAASRYAFYVDVSGVPPNETGAYLNKIKQGLNKQKFVNPQCLTGDTLIPCLDGKNRSIKELADSKIEPWILSFDLAREKIVPAKAAFPRKTGEKAKVYRVILDNGAVVRCTDKHPFLLRNGTYKYAIDLKAGDSLMPSKLSFGSKSRPYWSVRDHQNKAHMIHKLVATEVLGLRPTVQNHVHHKDRNKSNNYPDNLQLVSQGEHAIHHIDRLERASRNHMDRLKNDPSYLAEIVKRVNSGHTEKTRRNSGLRLGQLVTERRKNAKPNDNQFYEEIRKIIIEKVTLDPMIGLIELSQELNSDQDFLKNWRNIFNVDKKFISPAMTGWIIRKRFGYGSLSNLKKKICGESRRRFSPKSDTMYLNHKVVDVQFDGYEDVYDLTVEKYHNFALTAGIFVHNSGKMDQKFNILSTDDNFYLPTRDGKESTRVESLSGPVYDHIEDVRFFENKLFAALKVPKPFLTYEETTAKSHLSAEDARFARSILRVQREYKAGKRKVARVHLASKGINPDSVNFEMNMTVPSAIFELAQLEIKNAELELADKFSAWAPKEWIMHHILDFSEDQIRKMDEMRKREFEAGDVSPEPGRGGSGAIEKALSRRGERKPSSEREIPPEGVETASVSYPGKPVVVERSRKSLSGLKDKILEHRSKDKSFDMRWSDRLEFISEVKDAMKK